MRPIGLDVVHRDRLDAPGMVDEDFRIHAEDVVEPVPIGVERELAHSVYPQIVQASCGAGAHAPEVGDGGVVPERRAIAPFVEDAEEIGAVLRRYVERDLGEEEVGADAAGSRDACLRHDVFADAFSQIDRIGMVIG